jgi:hypothetical protein
MVSEPASPTNQPDPEFARAFSRALRIKRRTIGWTLERMAAHADQRSTSAIDATLLSDLEEGELGMPERRLLNDIAASYEIDLGSLGVAREPIEIVGDGFVIKDVRVEWASREIDDVLEAFLEIIGKVRVNSGGEIRGFRRTDIDAIAAHIGHPAAFLVERLGDLMGTRRSRGKIMSMIYLSGAPVIPTGLDDEESDAPPTRLATMLTDAEDDLAASH